MNKACLGLMIAPLSLLVLFGAGCSQPPDADSEAPAAGQAPSSNGQAGDENGISAEEQAFLDSGRAKATEKPSDLWPLRPFRSAGLYVAIPPDVAYDRQEGNGLYSMDVRVEALDGLEGTMGYNEETVSQAAVALAKGEYGPDIDFPLAESKRVIGVSGVNAQDFLVLGRFDVCDVRFERKALMSDNGHLAVITLSADAEQMVAALPDYFKANPDNCGPDPVWDLDKQADFQKALAAGTAPESVQGWYDLFDDVVAAVHWGEPATEPVAELALEGRWVSADDDKSEVLVKGGQWISMYDGRRLSESGYVYDAAAGSLTVNETEGIMEYTVVELTSDKLVLTYLARGNNLEYRRVAE